MFLAVFAGSLAYDFGPLTGVQIDRGTLIDLSASSPLYRTHFWLLGLAGAKRSGVVKM